MKKKLCVKLVIYKDYTEMHGQQNIKLSNDRAYLKKKKNLFFPVTSQRASKR